MSPLVVVIVGSAVALLCLIGLAVVCVCVCALAGRRDRQIETRAARDPRARLLTAVNDLGDQADHLWAEPQGADVIVGPWPPRSAA